MQNERRNELIVKTIAGIFFVGSIVGLGIRIAYK